MNQNLLFDMWVVATDKLKKDDFHGKICCHGYVEQKIATDARMILILYPCIRGVSFPFICAPDCHQAGPWSVFFSFNPCIRGIFSLFLLYYDRINL
jgi:hypothetical protein